MSDGKLIFTLQYGEREINTELEPKIHPGTWYTITKTPLTDINGTVVASAAACSIHGQATNEIQTRGGENTKYSIGLLHCNRAFEDKLDRKFYNEFLRLSNFAEKSSPPAPDQK